MYSPERLKAITRIVRAQRRVGFSELQKAMRVSAATLRRDLTELERGGDIIRVHGGVLDPGYVRSEVSFDERSMRNTAAKRAIAARAVSLVPSGVSVFIDAGSTCLEAGKALLGRNDVRLITHSVTLLEAALRARANNTVCLGGELRAVSGALTGCAALGALASLHIDVAMMGASGVDAKLGCSTTELFEAEIKKEIIARSSKAILLADRSKWQNPSTVHFCLWKDLNAWVTDKAPSVKDTRPLRAAGVAIHEARAK